ARLAGTDGRGDVTRRLDKGRGKRPRPVWKNGPVTIQNTAVERREASAPSHGAQRSPSHGEHTIRCASSALRSLSSFEGRGKETRTCLKSLNSGVRSVGFFSAGL